MLPSPERDQETEQGCRPELPMATHRSTPAAPEPGLEFGRFSISLRHRELFADGVPVKLGTRAFDLLMVLLEGNGALVTKHELLRRAWPGVVVADDNLKVQISELRRALAGDRDLIRTEIGRGYWIAAAIRRTGVALPTVAPMSAAANPSADRAAPDAAPGLVAIAAQLATIEAKLAEALDSWPRSHEGLAVSFPRGRSCAERAGRNNLPSPRRRTPPAAPPGPRRVLRWRSPA
jgi:DNA-binding winged helix-turn-helix (wHTH) protein